MEDLQRQLGEIAASLQEEKLARQQEAQLRHQAEQRLAALEAAQAQAQAAAPANLTAAPSPMTSGATTPFAQPAPVPMAPPAPPAPPSQTPIGPKVAVPDKFNGSCGVKAEVYASQVGLYMMAYPYLFPDDRSKVVFAMSYLTGAASSWAQPMVQDLFEASTSHLVTYDRFTTNFKAMYFDTEKKSKAEKALRALKQTKSVAAYVHEFNLHARNTGWETPTLISQFEQGLKRDIRVAMVVVKDEFDTLETIANFAVKIDNKLHGVSQDPPTPSTSAAPASDPDAMDVSATRFGLSEEEKERRRRRGDCFKCGEHGHISQFCPGNGKSGKGKGRAGDKLKIAELEERLAKFEGKDSGGGTKDEEEGRADKSKNGGAWD